MSVLGVVFASVVVAVPASGRRREERADRLRALPPPVGGEPGRHGERKFEHIKRSEDIQPDWSPDGAKIAIYALRERAVRALDGQVRRDWIQARRPDCCARPAASTGAAPPGRPTRSGSRSARRPTSRTAPRGPRDLRHEREWKRRAPGHGHVGRQPAVCDRPLLADLVTGRQAARLRGEALRSADPPNRRAFFIIEVDGTGLRQLTPWSLNAGGRPDWSPDGKLILFRTISTSNRHHGNLHTIHPDGTGLRKLTNYPAPKTVLNGSFSPDGKWIAFSRFTDGPYPAVYVMRLDGTGVRRVTSNAGVYDLDWGPARG